MNIKHVSLVLLLCTVSGIYCNESFLQEQLKKNNPELFQQQEQAEIELENTAEYKKALKMKETVEAFDVVLDFYTSRCNHIKSKNALTAKFSWLNQNCNIQAAINEMRENMAKKSNELIEIAQATDEYKNTIVIAEKIEQLKSA